MCQLFIFKVLTNIKFKKIVFKLFKHDNLYCYGVYFKWENSKIKDKLSQFDLSSRPIQTRN